jgi:hypothetical protein
MFKGVLRTVILLAFCGTAFGVDSQVSWISRDTRPDFSRTPANPTTNDRINFVIPTDVFRNHFEGEQRLGGTPNLIIDAAQKTIDLRFLPPAPKEPQPSPSDPVSGVQGYFGPLEEGSWLFTAQFQGVYYTDTINVLPAGTGSTTTEFPVEQFTGGADSFDLMYESVLFTPTAGGTSYSVEIQEITELPTDPSGSTNLQLGDDESKLVNLAGSASVSIYGQSFSSFYISSNGYITFTESDKDYSESLRDQFDTLRVSALFHDFNPTAGGQVSGRQLGNRAVITWEDVPEYHAHNSNTFQLELFFDGRIRISWEHVDAARGIVGLSDGQGVPAGFEEIDFSDLSAPPPTTTSPVEQFTGGDDSFDLAYESLTFTPNADGTAYGATLQSISQLPTDPSGGTDLGLGDDAYVLVKLGSPATVSIYGTRFTGFYVGSNGYITFTQGDQTYADTLENHFDMLRVSSLFQDLNPSGGGKVTWKQLGDRAVVTWENIPEYGTSNSNTFQIALFYDGRIRISWTGVDARQCIVGLSDGLGVPPDFQEADFSELSGGGGPPPVTEFPVEQFTGGADAFDLQNTAILFTPTQDGTAYNIEADSISHLPTNPAGGTDLGLGDDTYTLVKLGSPATVSIYGNSFPAFYVGSNGYITFTGGDQDYSPSLEDQFDMLRISGFFRDLNPAAGGQVSWRQLANRVAVTWQNVPAYGATTSNTFQIELAFDGRIRLSWLTMGADSGIVGLSDGGGVPADFEETDFSALSETPPPPPPVTDFYTEEFTAAANPFDLQHKSVTFTPTADGTAYTGSLRAITELPTNPSGGTNLGLRDDNWVRVSFSNQAQVKIFGQTFASFYVGANGYITFTQGDTDFSPTLAEHFDRLRISGLYCDLTAASTGSATGKQLSNRVAITWQGVPEFSNTAPNTFQIELFYDGRIRLSWMDIGSQNNIVGLSDGQGLPEDFEETDFSVRYAQP